jgi:hypothetical protein
MSGILSAASKAGVETGTFAVSGEDAAYRASHGFARVIVASDIALLRTALTRDLALARPPTGRAGSDATDGEGPGDRFAGSVPA